MLKRLLVVALLCLGATHAAATTLTITAQGTVDSAVAGIGANVNDSFSLTATVSEPAFSEVSSSSFGVSIYRIETLTAVIGPSTLSLTVPTNDAFLSVTVDTQFSSP